MITLAERIETLRLALDEAKEQAWEIGKEISLRKFPDLDAVVQYFNLSVAIVEIQCKYDHLIQPQTDIPKI